MAENVWESPDDSIEGNKIDRATFVRISSGLNSRNPVQASTRASNQNNETAELLSDTGCLEQVGKIRTSLVDRNLKISNKRKTRLQVPHLVIETKAFTKGLGVHYSGILTGRMWSKEEKKNSYKHLGKY